MTQAFNLSQFANFVNTSGKADLTTAVTGTLPVANGGTGQVTLSSGAVLLGNGTTGITSVSPATAGNLLYANGSTWVSQTPAFGINIDYYTTTSTWTVPAGVNKALVWVFGGAGGGYTGSITGGIGGFGGYIAGLLTGISGTLSITVGAGGTQGSPGASGGTSSVSQGATTYISATGGSGSSYGTAANGTGTLGAGVTRIRLLCGLENAQSSPVATSLPNVTFNITGNPQTIYYTPQSTIFVQSGLLSGRGNTIWSTNYLEAPGTPFQAYSSGTPNGNGLGGAVIIQY